MPFILTPPGSTDLESLEFDGLALNDAVFGLAEFSCPPPPERPEWIGAADSEAQLLVGTPKHENRDITLKLQVTPQVNMDLALDQVGALLDKCVKASKYQDGIELAWNPATSARFVTFDVLSAQITDLPVDWENGWLAFAPTITVAMKAKPYWRGEETLTSTTSSSTPFVTAELVNNSGDVPALGRLIVTDTATQSRRHVEWGLEGPLTYNAATSLLIDSDDMVTSGFGGTATTQSGAYDPNASGNSVVGITARTAVAAMAGVGNLSHVGAFKVKARVYSDASTLSVRLSWRAADGPMSSNSWATHAGGSTWRELDLGTITIPAVLTGTQRWTGQVEVKTSTGTATVRVDYLELIPTTCGYGKARGIYAYAAGPLSGLDDFASTTAGSNLNTRTAVLGGSWATSGSTTDFQFSDDLGGEQLKRSTTSDAGYRFAVLGSSNYTDMQVESLVRQTSTPSTSSRLELGVIARWVDSSNYVRGTFAKSMPSLGIVLRELILTHVVAGVATSTTAVLPASLGSNAYYTIRLTAFSSGRAVLSLLNEYATTTHATVETSSSALATGGALDDGKPGLIDANPNLDPITRYYDNVTVSTPPAEAVAVYSGQSIEFRHDDTIREDSTGTYYGRPQSYRGSRFLVPVGTSRVLVKARRNDVETAADDNVTDATQIQVGVTPRGLVVPRA